MRARNIKPGFFTNEKLVALPPLTRLLFIGLWCKADCRGITADRPGRLKLELFPADAIDIDQGLADLQAAGLITRYTDANGLPAVLIPNFRRHQNPHPKEKPDPTILAPGERPENDQPRNSTAGRENKLPAGLNPESSFLNPESGGDLSTASRENPRPAAPAQPPRFATAKQVDFAHRLLGQHGLTIAQWLKRLGRPAGDPLTDPDIDAIKAAYGRGGGVSGPRGHDLPEAPDPDWEPGERERVAAVLAGLRRPTAAIVPHGTEN